MVESEVRWLEVECADVGHLLGHTGGLVTESQLTALGQAEMESAVAMAVRRRTEAQDEIASTMRLRGGGWGEKPRGGDGQGRADKRPWGDGDEAEGRSGGKRRAWGGEGDTGTDSGKQSAASGGDDYYQSVPQGAEEWCRVTEEIAARKVGSARVSPTSVAAEEFAPPSGVGNPPFGGNNTRSAGSMDSSSQR